jgi:hypothetical protein
MLNTFVKTYSNRLYKHVMMVCHKGAVIALALDQDRHLFYSILDLQNKEIKSPLDVNFWFANPKELYFPNEIANLVDRFVLSGAELKTKMEARFQRSRSKTHPQSRKDSLGARDMDDNPFSEPTQELHFVSNLIEGRFTALLLPTQLPNVQRWQIFAHNSRTSMIDSYNVQRSDDGLFNTRGTQEINTQGHAESAVDFGDGKAFVELNAGVSVGTTFTPEAWIFPRSSAPLTPD